MKIFSVSRRFALSLSVVFVALLVCASDVRAGSWNGIEPFKSRRADVLRVLGTPINDPFGGPVTFKILGGTASVSFVDQNFVRIKKLSPELEGTVLQIILQHENASDTPESMGLLKKSSFTHEEAKNVLIFRNLKEGIVYTFVDKKLKTTRYTFSDGQLSRAKH